MPNDYEVGYGRPPKEGQFVKGQSGNPKGRPKGSKNIGTLFNEITRELISVTENGRTKSMTRMEAILHRMTNLALSGDPRALREMIHLSRVFEQTEEADDTSLMPRERETAVFQSFLERVGRLQQIANAEGDGAANRAGKSE